jgi:hypothetical protein
VDTRHSFCRLTRLEPRRPARNLVAIATKLSLLELRSRYIQFSEKLFRDNTLHSGSSYGYLSNQCSAGQYQETRCVRNVASSRFHEMLQPELTGSVDGLREACEDSPRDNTLLRAGQTVPERGNIIPPLPSYVSTVAKVMKTGSSRPRILYAGFYVSSQCKQHLLDVEFYR